MRSSPPSPIEISECDRCHFAIALSGSTLRAEATALSLWRDELDMCEMARRIREQALHLPIVELAPTLQIALAGSNSVRTGKFSVYLAINTDHCVANLQALRRLWGRMLSAELLEGYNPLVINAALTKQMASSAAVGSKGEDWAEEQIANGRVMLCVVEMAPQVHALAMSAAADVSAATDVSAAAGGLQVLQTSLQQSAALHLFVPNGHVMDKEVEALANKCVATSIGTTASSIHLSHFSRGGRAGGGFDATNVVELLGRNFDVRREVSGEWGSHVEFVAATDAIDGSVKAVAMAYISGPNAMARKKRSKVGDAGSATRRGDGENQPRLFRVYPPIRGVELDDPALDKLSQAAECDAFMERVAIPRVAVACDSLMTLRHLGYGGLALSAKGNPIAKASSMVERVYAQSESVEWAHAHIAINGAMAVNCQHLALHVVRAASTPHSP